MPKRPVFENLGEWLNPPTVQDQVVSYMIQLETPALLREIYRPLALQRASVNRVLLRLHNRGVVRRWKIPVEARLPNGRPRDGAQGPAMRQCYLYQLVGDETA